MSKKPLIAQRWLMIAFATFGSALMYILRYNISVAIVAMVQPKNLHHLEQQRALEMELHLIPSNESYAHFSRSVRSLRPSSNGSNDSSTSHPNSAASNDSVHIMPIPYIGFDWDDNVQGMVLSSYFYGYTILQILGGRLSEKYGAKWVLAAGVALPSVFTWLTPLAAESNAWFLVAARVLIGLSHATVLSTGFAVISAWLPDSEKSTAAVLLNVGLELGGMIALLFTGWACAQPELGWRASFYINGFAPLLWLVPFVFLFYSRPDTHPQLSAYESRLIARGKPTYESIEPGMRRVPAKLRWPALFRCRAVWANCSAKGCGYFGYYVLTTKMPAILDELFQLPIERNGQLCALSFVAVLMAKLLCIPLANHLKARQIMSLTNLRKLFQGISMLMSAAAMLLLTQVSNSLPLSIVCILITMFGTGLQCGGETPQLTDFAQDLSGTVFGFCNMFLSLDGILAPFIAGEILEYCTDVRSGWNMVFYMCSGVYLVGAILFLWLADSTPQQWAMATYEPEVTLSTPRDCIPSGSCTQLSSAEVIPAADDSPPMSVRF